MHNLIIVPLYGIAILCSFCGWGGLVLLALRLRVSTGAGFNAATGLAFTTGVGAFLNMLQLISRRMILGYLAVGIVLFVVFFLKDFNVHADRWKQRLAGLKQPKLWWLLVVGIVLVTANKYVAVISPADFHPQDDYHAYFVYPLKMLQTGSLGRDPFSERRVVSSLGGNYFLDAMLVAVTGDTANLRLMDEGVCYLIVLLLLAEIMRRNNLRRAWLLTLLLAATLLMAPTVNITAIYGAAALFLLLFQVFDSGHRSRSLAVSVLFGLTVAGLISLKTTFAPAAGILFISFYLLQLWSSPDRKNTIVRAAVSSLTILLLLFPWMLASHWSNGTWFYPLLGKGYHGSQYGVYLLPTAHMGLHNLLAFCSALSTVLGVMLFVEFCAIITVFVKGLGRGRIVEGVLAVNLAVDMVVIGYAIGGVQTYRYTFPILFSFALFLLIKLLVLSADSPLEVGDMLLTDRKIAVLVLGILLGSSWNEFLIWQFTVGAKQLVASLQGTEVSTPEEVDAYQRMQNSVPAGEKLLVRLDKNFLLDFRRNEIYVDDLPGGASLPPGIPIFKGSEPIAQYLLQHGIRYVAYSYGDQATFDRVTFKGRLAPKVNIWLRKGAEIAFDFQDNLSLLGQTRRRVYDDGSMFVLDLASTHPGSPQPTERAATVKPASLTLPSRYPLALTSDALPDRTVSFSPGMTTEALQAGLMRAPRGAAVQFAAGTYRITTTLQIPCKDLHLSGPAGPAPTAVLSASFKNSSIFAFFGGCDHLGSIRNLHFTGTGAVYFGVGSNSNLVFASNFVTSLPSGLSNVTSESGLFFDGHMGTTLSNITISGNTFGSPDSCVAVYATPKDQGGYCAGVITSQGEIDHLTIDHNRFLHVEQGVHLNQLATFDPGKPNSVCVSCTINYNYVNEYHRIGIEVQVSTPDDSLRIEHNAIVDPIASSWGTFAVSLACCQSSRIIGTNGYSPSVIFNDNVLVASKPIGAMCPPYGVEFWGLGAQGLNSLVQGTFCNGYTWGYGSTPWAIKNNYICGPNYVPKGGYITNQQHQTNPPLQAENITGPSCIATPSHKPVISPAGGTFGQSQLVTLTDPGLNTSVWYTTDGSAPIPGSPSAHLYVKPILVSSTTTLKAVGMWGAGNQPVTYPEGYGYVPSEVVSATYAVKASTDGKPASGPLRLTATTFLHR